MQDAKRKIFRALIKSLRSGTYASNSINLNNFGLRLAHILVLCSALKIYPKARNILCIDLSNYTTEDLNEFSYLSITGLDGLLILNARSVGLAIVTIRNCKALHQANFSDNNIEHLCAENLPMLYDANFNDNLLPSFNPTKYPNLAILSLRGNPLRVVDVSGMNLNTLDISGCPVQTFFAAGTPLHAKFHCSSELFDLPSQVALALRIPAAVTVKTKATTLTLEQIYTYLKKLAQSYRAHRAADDFGEAAIFYIKWHIALQLNPAPTQTCFPQLYSDDLLLITAAQVLKLNFTKSLVRVADSLANTTDANDPNRKIISFVKKHIIPDMAMELAVEAQHKLMHSRVIPRLIAKRIVQKTPTDPLDPNCNAVPPALTWQLSNSKLNLENAEVCDNDSKLNLENAEVCDNDSPQQNCKTFNSP